ncbi:uncharacterized protein F4812DRAFT_454151 [Daldinia caldariorum]|uniref:uncharacterized protein n=1 Tax=Daldinia caldariorum TaxID=326644 RepID=UPI002007C6AF|nr:uncharacterized protein F4812DRAFT_454151 [Daldinia caldariorum]KAI1472334.1 hypothetical protein F4812DRAFT_454151 [Daldinia caldariorum]
MLAMTRLPPDSFLPSSDMLDPNLRSMPFASHLNGHSSASVISPLSLPHALNTISPKPTNLPPSDYSHSPSVSIPSQSQEQYLPLPTSPNIPVQRSTSLSPTRYQIGSGATSPSLVPSTALDNMSHQALFNLLQRREEQNRKLIENMRAERAHFEASRTRAEEMYQEERAIIEEERILWLEEKNNLRRDLSEWKRRAELAEKQRDEMASLLGSIQAKGGYLKMPVDSAHEAAIGSLRGGGLSSLETPSQSSANFWSPSDGTSPKRVLPTEFHGSTTMPESRPFIPLDPRMQGPSPGVSSPAAQQERVPSIDIQEVIPGLEGIRVRPDIVQKATFTDDKPSAWSTGTISPPVPGAKQEPIRPRAGPAELTKETLQAPESDRLIMHAGHTPNHSISLSRLHTVESTAAVNTADSSGSSTPRHSPEEEEQQQQAEVSEEVANSEASRRNLEFLIAADVQDEFEDEKDKDPELKGPLTLRNLPAADEPFLKALNDKLADVITHDATPTVLKHGSYFTTDSSEPLAKTDDAVHDVHEELEEQEEEVPLKLKPSSNFGAPLGQLRKP